MPCHGLDHHILLLRISTAIKRGKSAIFWTIPNVIFIGIHYVTMCHVYIQLYPYYTHHVWLPSPFLR